MPTIHNQAPVGKIAPTVLMPGDPLRADYIAQTYLSSAELLSRVRGIPVYTGLFRGVPVSVMASGMGAGSMGIYSHELYHDYNVQRILRVGTAGGLDPQLQLQDLLLALSCSTDSGFAAQFELPGIYAPCASFRLARIAAETAEKQGLSVRAGMFFSGEAFHYKESYLKRWAAAGALAVEMETAALYMNAAAAGREALTICTITDMVFDNRHCTPEERQTSLDDMLQLALQVAVQ